LTRLTRSRQFLFGLIDPELRVRGLQLPDGEPTGSQEPGGVLELAAVDAVGQARDPFQIELGIASSDMDQHLAVHLLYAWLLGQVDGRFDRLDDKGLGVGKGEATKVFEGEQILHSLFRVLKVLGESLGRK